MLAKYKINKRVVNSYQRKVMLFLSRYIRNFQSELLYK